MYLHELFESIKTVEKPELKGLWFKHQSSKKLSILKPLSYKQLAASRDTDYPIEDRKDQEWVYKSLIHNSDKMSFLYATVVRYNKFEKPSDYPGYTYYFKLTPDQIKHCVFTIIDKKTWMEPTLGKPGLKKAQAIWDKHKDKFKQYTEEHVGVIYPRIEVVIPLTVHPVMMVAQEEDR